MLMIVQKVYQLRNCYHGRCLYNYTVKNFVKKNVRLELLNRTVQCKIGNCSFG